MLPEQLSFFDNEVWLKSWEKDLKKKICKELIKQGFEIEFAEGIVARTLKELEIILNCLDELGVELL
ncbi:MAG: hypothetical protein DRI52_11485 [Chloroflexi bacterium]|nr:MAG: hypothetical protein DRI52_11485 [Chloroflexota bacterium]